VGQVVAVHFNERIPDKAAAQRLLEVKTDPATPGGWNWIDSQNVHWRPQETYWKPGTSVTVKADVYGHDLGGGLYGRSTVTASFKIGQSKVAIADANTHRMQVYFDGQLVRDIPVSLGKGGTAKGANGETVNFWTNSGVHVVLEKTPTTQMTSASFGITDKKDPNFYDELIKLTVRISASGEFVHLADWNVPAHGHANTSHGCVNVGPANAKWFYDNFDMGDVVEVRNTPVKLGLTNGIGDWNVGWEQWKKGSAL
jgi:lipoprotein-anchoring transpeptidase ErfK/SrfK